MKKKRKSSWSELYLIAAVGCAMLFVEGVLPMTHHTRQIALIMTLVAMFWLMNQWMRASRFNRIMSRNTFDSLNRQPVTRIQTYYDHTISADSDMQHRG